MKNLILSSLLFLLPSLAHAEILNIQAGFSFMRCEKVKEDTICNREPRALNPLQIDVSQPNEEGALWGEVRFYTTEDGVEFEGTIEVKKITEGEKIRYEAEVYVASLAQDDSIPLSFDFIGMTTVKEDFSNLGPTIFTGRRLKSEKVDLTPFITIRLP